MAEWKAVGLISAISTTTMASMTPVDLENFSSCLRSRRRMRELFPDPVGPMMTECAILRMVLLPLAMASSMNLRNAASATEKTQECYICN